MMTLAHSYGGGACVICGPFGCEAEPASLAPREPSERAVNAARDGMPLLTDCLKRAYAVDVPAIERAAAERAVWDFARFLHEALEGPGHGVHEAFWIADHAKRFLADRGGER